MYAIIVYDVNVGRVSKVCQFLRRYLDWIQNSVFEGELSESQLIKVEDGLKEIIDEDEDSILIYILTSEKLLKRKFMGRRKGETSPII